VVSPCRCLATAVAGLLGRVLPAELSWLLIDQRRLAGGACGRRPSGRTSLPRPGMPARRPCRPSPIRVHHWVSTPFGSHVRVRASSRPVSSRPVSGQLVPSSGIRLSGVRPSASGRLVSARPPDHLRLVRVSPAVALEITSVRRAIFTTGTDRVACGRRCPERLGRAPSRPGGGRCGGGGEAGGGAAIADLAGSGPGRGCGHAPPLTGQGRPVRREGRRWLPADPGMGARVQARRSWPWRGGISAQSMTTLRGRCGA
jgi:hypothetical protein